MTLQALSFPNCLCFLIVFIATFHMFTRDATTRTVQEVQDNLDVIYCKFPQTQGLEETKRCSSVQSFFLLLENGCSHQKRSGEVVLQLDLENGLVNGEDGASKEIVMEESTYEGSMRRDADGEDDKKESKKDKEETSSFLVDSFVITLLIFSASVSLIEWYREKTRNSKQQVVGGEGLPPLGDGESIVSVGNRRFSLADLTVNRHIRRKESQHQQVVRQASASASVKTGPKPPPLLRRSSFPAQFPEVRTRQAPQRQQSHPGVHPSRRMSVDLLEDDSSPDRRRVRIIRRH